MHQREIVEVEFNFPDGQKLKHPALVVSTDELHEAEDGMFYAVLISTKNLHPEYTIEIKNEDIIGRPLDAQSYFVTHFMTYFHLRDIMARKNTFVTVRKFDEVVQKSIDNIFGPPLSDK